MSAAPAVTPETGGARTLWESLTRAIVEHAHRPCVALRGAQPELRWSYRDFGQRVEAAAQQLSAAGIGPGDRVLFWGTNRPQWLAGFFGLFRLGAVAVPLDYRSAPDFVQRVAEKTRPKALVVDRAIADRLTLDLGPRFLIDELALAEFDPARPLPPLQGGPDDLVEIVFTSGTTGEPKGVMITNRNLLANMEAVELAIEVQSYYRLISLLPLSHLFEQVGTMAVLHKGASIVYLHTLRPESIFEAIKEEQATTILAVPQVLDLFLQGVEREVRKAGRQKQWELLHRAAARLPFGLRRYLFLPLHRKLGGKFEFFFAGGAMLDPEIGLRWENMGIKVIQGYGMTEAAPGVTMTRMSDRPMSCVGWPLKGIELKIASNGEVLIRGPQVFPGYWENPEATEAAFENGWYKTGDLGEIDSRGCLRLRGRVKNLIVLANGMNVYPEDVESVLRLDPSVKDAVVVGLKRGRADIDVHAVLAMHDPDRADAAVRAANRQLGSHQQIRGFTIWPEEDFPRTLTMKARRPVIQEQLREMGVGETV